MTSKQKRRVLWFSGFLLILAWCGRDGERKAFASGIATVSSVFGQVGAVNIPVTTTDISTPSNPVAGKTTWYTKAGTFCSLSPAGSELCTNAGGGGTVDNNTVKNAIFISDTSVSANTITGTTGTAFPLAYAAGQLVIVKLANTVTGATTININSLGAKNVTKNGTTALQNLDMLVGGIYPLTYDGTEFVLTQNLPAGGGTGATVTSGVFGSAPTCTTSQFVYVTTDAGLALYCNGSSALTRKYGLFSIVPPVLGDTAWFNQTSATISSVPAGILLTSSPGSGNNNVNARVEAYPSTPFTQIGCFDGAVPPANFASVGMFISDGTNTSTSKLVTTGLGNSSSGSTGGTIYAIQTFDQRFTNVTTSTTNPAYTTYGVNLPICFAMQDDGTTNRKLAFSYDRQNWIVTLTEGRTTFLTPAEIGYYVNTGSSGLAPIMHLVSWELVGSTLF